MHKNDSNARYQQRLVDEHLTARDLRDANAESLPEPHFIPLSPNTFVSNEVQVRLANGIGGNWIPSLPEVKQRTAQDFEERMFRLAQMMAEEDAKPWSDMLTLLADVLAADLREVDRFKAETQNTLKKAQKTIDSARSHSKAAAPTNMLGRVFSFANNVKDLSEQITALNELEEASFRQDVQTMVQEVLVQAREDLLKTIEPCDQLQSKLDMAQRGAELEDFSEDGSSALRLPGVSWEPVGPLARILTENEGSLALPRDLMHSVRQGVDVAQQRLDEQTVADAHRQPMSLRLKSALEKTHGEDLKLAGWQISLAMNEGAGRDPLLFQLVERGPDGQMPGIWPSLPQETEILAPDGPAFVLGFLRVDGAEEVGTFLGADLPSVGVANAYCNLDLAARYASSEPEVKARAS